MTRLLPLLVLLALLGACGDAREHPAVQICDGCTAAQVCVYVKTMSGAATNSETARCVERAASCSQEALGAKSGDCTAACRTQFCGAGGNVVCSYEAGPGTVPKAEVTVVCHW